MQPEPDSVVVLVDDLHTLKMTLTSAYNEHEARDLADNYRKLNNRVQLSAMTRSLGEMIATVDSWIEEAQQEDG